MANTTFTTPGEDRYLEDYIPNTVHVFGPIAVEQDEVNAFVKYFNPQNSHTDSDTSAKTAFESLAAGECTSERSMMRLLTDFYLPEADNLNSPEIEQFCRIRRVRPGDKLILRVTVTGSLRSTSEPSHGMVHSFIEVLNQNREVVMSMIMKNILLCSPK